MLPVIITVVVMLVLGIVVFAIWYNTRKGARWDCTDSGCEYDINGEYPSKQHCMDACKKKLAMMHAVPTQENDKLDAWACTSDYQCVRSDQGYTNRNLCEQNCKTPVTTPTYYYYPQTLLRPYRRPYYWRPRSPRRHGTK